MILPPSQLIFYLLVAAIPAYLFNKQLQKWTQPRKSGRNFLLYLLLVLLVAFLYTSIVLFILMKYVWRK
jgi:hypothetical protein